MRVTHGCIRMFPEDIEFAFGHIPVGTPVRIIDEPYKFGWYEGQLLMEAHEPLENPAAEEGGVVGVSALTRLTELYVAATGERRIEVDWDRVEALHRAADGIPRRVDAAGDGGGTLVADSE